MAELWSDISGLLRLSRSGDLDLAQQQLERLWDHPGLDQARYDVLARHLLRRWGLRGGAAKINRPVEFTANRDGRLRPPFRVLDVDQEGGLVLPPGLALAPRTGTGNASGFLHQAAALTTTPPQVRIHIFYALQDADADATFLDSLAAQVAAPPWQMTVFAGPHAERVTQEIHRRGLPGKVRAETLLESAAQTHMMQTAGGGDLVLLLSGALRLDPGALARAAHLGQISDLVVQPLRELPEGLTPYASTSAAGILDPAYPFRNVAGLNLVLSQKMLSQVGGLDPRFDSHISAGHELAFRCFNAGAYFAPLLVPKLGPAPGLDDAADKTAADQILVRSLCPNIWDRPVDGRFEVPKLSLCIAAGSDIAALCRTLDSVLAQRLKDLEVCVPPQAALSQAQLEQLQAAYDGALQLRWSTGAMAMPGSGITQLFALARGSYIALLEPGCSLQPGALRHVMAHLDGQRNVVCCHGVNLSEGAAPVPLLLSRDALMQSPATPEFIMFRRAAWERTAKPDIDLSTAAAAEITLQLDEVGLVHHLGGQFTVRQGSKRPCVAPHSGRVQRAALRRQGLDHVWHAYAPAPDTSQRVGFKRISTQPRVMFWPDYSHANPYQTLLYQSATRRHEILVAPIETALIAQQRMQGSEEMIFHLHWTNFLFQGAENRAVARLRLRRFLKDLTQFKQLGGRIIWTVHNTVSHDTPFAELDIALSRRIVALADVLHFHSAASVPEVAAVFELPEDKIRISRHGHYLGVYGDHVTGAAARQCLGLDPTEDVILFAGQVRPYKGVEGLLRSFRQILGDNPQARLVIAGLQYGDIFAQLQPVLSAAERARILLVDRFLDDSELQVFFRAADVAVFPYRTILTSGSLLLSLSFGVPPVIPRVGMTADLLQGREAGFLYDRASPEALTQALQQALTCKRQGGLAQMQRNALALAQSQSWPDVAQTLFAASAPEAPAPPDSRKPGAA